MTKKSARATNRTLPICDKKLQRWLFLFGWTDKEFAEKSQAIAARTDDVKGFREETVRRAMDGKNMARRTHSSMLLTIRTGLAEYNKSHPEAAIPIEEWPTTLMREEDIPRVSKGTVSRSADVIELRIARPSETFSRRDLEGLLGQGSHDDPNVTVIGIREDLQ